VYDYSEIDEIADKCTTQELIERELIYQRSLGEYRIVDLLRDIFMIRDIL